MTETSTPDCSLQPVNETDSDLDLFPLNMDFEFPNCNSGIESIFNIANVPENCSRIIDFPVFSSPGIKVTYEGLHLNKDDLFVWNTLVESADYKNEIGEIKIITDVCQSWIGDKIIYMDQDKFEEHISRLIKSQIVIEFESGSCFMTRLVFSVFSEQKNGESQKRLRVKICQEMSRFTSIGPADLYLRHKFEQQRNIERENERLKRKAKRDAKKKLKIEA